MPVSSLFGWPFIVSRCFQPGRNERRNDEEEAALLLHLGLPHVAFFLLLCCSAAAASSLIQAPTFEDSGRKISAIMENQTGAFDYTVNIHKEVLFIPELFQYIFSSIHFAILTFYISNKDNSYYEKKSTVFVTH